MAHYSYNPHTHVVFSGPYIGEVKLTFFLSSNYLEFEIVAARGLQLVHQIEPGRSITCQLHRLHPSFLPYLLYIVEQGSQSRMFAFVALHQNMEGSGAPAHSVISICFFKTVKLDSNLNEHAMPIFRHIREGVPLRRRAKD